jgi:hypothetical protein
MFCPAFSPGRSAVAREAAKVIILKKFRPGAVAGVSPTILMFCPAFPPGRSAVAREAAKVIILKKFRPDPGFLDCGGLTPLWIFPIDALYSHPKLRQAGALQDTLMATKRLGQLHNLG